MSSANQQPFCWNVSMFWEKINWGISLHNDWSLLLQVLYDINGLKQKKCNLHLFCITSSISMALWKGDVTRCWHSHWSYVPSASDIAFLHCEPFVLFRPCRWHDCCLFCVIVIDVLCCEFHQSSSDHFVYAPSQWEMALHCNAISHWLGAFSKWSLKFFS